MLKLIERKTLNRRTLCTTGLYPPPPLNNRCSYIPVLQHLSVCPVSFVCFVLVFVVVVVVVVVVKAGVIQLF